MKDSKYLKDTEAGEDVADDAEAEQDKDMFKKKTYKNSGTLSRPEGDLYQSPFT